MKVLVSEHDGCFGVDLTAETMQEAATLVRMGMNRTEEVHHAAASAGKGGEFGFCLVFGKAKMATEYVPRRGERRK